MKCTVYKRPNGRTEEIYIENIADDDRFWFESNNVKLSMEDIGLAYALYADIGIVLEDGTPNEIIHITSSGETCEQALHELRVMCEGALNE